MIVAPAAMQPPPDPPSPQPAPSASDTLPDLPTRVIRGRRYYSVAQVCQLTGMSTAAVARAHHHGELRGVQLVPGGRIWVDAEDVEKRLTPPTPEQQRRARAGLAAESATTAATTPERAPTTAVGPVVDWAYAREQRAALAAQCAKLPPEVGLLLTHLNEDQLRALAFAACSAEWLARYDLLGARAPALRLITGGEGDRSEGSRP